jgi:hypothetical protein
MKAFESSFSKRLELCVLALAYGRAGAWGKA